MTTRPLQMSFHNLTVSAAVEEEIRERAAWLESFHPRIIGCRVLVDVPHRHRTHVRPIQVRVEVSLPGEDVVVTREHDVETKTGSSPQGDWVADGSHKDVVVAIHDAFEVARRRVEDATRRQRGDVKKRAATR